MTAIGRQTAMPLLGATLIAIIAFLPIFMSPDYGSVYTRVFVYRTRCFLIA